MTRLLLTIAGAIAFGAGCAGASASYQDMRRAAWAEEPARGPAPAAADSGSERAAAPAAASRPAGQDGPFAGLDELTSETLVAATLARNPGLSAMRAAWQAAVERYPQVTALDDPELAYGIAPGTIGARDLDFGQRFDLSQRLPWPGRLAARGEGALGEAAAAGAEYEATRQDLIAAARDTFYAYYFADRALATNATTTDLLIDLQRAAEGRYAAGLAAKADPLSAELAYHRSHHRRYELERTRAVAAARIRALVNLPADAPVPPPPAELAVPAAEPPVAALLCAALRERPEIAALRHEIDARRAAVREAGLDYFPTLTAMAVYDGLWEREEQRPMVGVGVNLPLQLERRRAAVSEARARLRAAESRLEERRARVRFEVERAAEEVAEQSHLVYLAETAIVPAARESLTASRSAYESGEADFLRVIEGDRALELAELAHHAAVADYHKARARLARAAGVPDLDVAGAAPAGTEVCP